MCSAVSVMIDAVLNPLTLAGFHPESLLLETFCKR